MARKKITTNISYDEDRKLYYVCLNWGRNTDGKYIKTYETATNQRDAKRILTQHAKKMATGSAIMKTVPSRTTASIIPCSFSLWAALISPCCRSLETTPTTLLKTPWALQAGWSTPTAVVSNLCLTIMPRPSCGNI